MEHGLHHFLFKRADADYILGVKADQGKVEKLVADLKALVGARL